MNKKLSTLLITALILTSTLPAQAWFKETAVSAFNTIKKHPAILSAVGFAAAAACLYKSNVYQKESDKWETYVANLTDENKKLINECIGKPLHENKPIHISGKLYHKIYDAYMEENTKRKLKEFIQCYNELLEENPDSPAFHDIKDGLRGLIYLLNNRQHAIGHRDKLEEYSDRWYWAAALCGIASLIPLAIAYK